MAADHTWVQGDTAPDLADTLSYSDGTPVDLMGCTVELIMRALTAAAPLALQGTVTVVNETDGDVQFTAAGTDTATPGQYMGNWRVTFQDAQVMTFPTIGYLSLEVTENLTTTGGAQLVGLPDLKDYLNIPAGDRVHDGKLLRAIEAVRPVIEDITGPIVVQTFDEWHDGGTTRIRLRRRPSTAPGTTPVLTITSIDEYRGPTRFPLTVAADPAAAGLYSVMLDSRVATVTRRTTGGGAIAFPSAPSAVHVVYQAGQTTVPRNVHDATLELIRVNYQTTQSTGRGVFTQADGNDTGMPLGFFVPRRVRELLAPNRRHPSIA